MEATNWHEKEGAPLLDNNVWFTICVLVLAKGVGWVRGQVSVQARLDKLFCYGTGFVQGGIVMLKHVLHTLLGKTPH